MTQDPASRGLSAFAVVWSGQLVSILGSGLTDFAVGVWVFRQSGLVTDFALIVLASTVPRLLVTPLAGALVDRWDRRRVLILSDSGAALETLAIALLLWSGQLHVRTLCLVIAVGSIFDAFHMLAMTASTTMLVPKRHLARVGGMMQIGPALAQILSPVLAVSLLATIGLQGVILVDFATFLVALLTLLVVRIPKPQTSRESREAGGSLRRQLISGWSFIEKRPGLLRLLAFFAVVNFCAGFATVLFLPLVLSFTSMRTAGYIASVGSAGLLAGSLTISLWGGPKQRIRGVLGFGLLMGACFIVAGIQPSAIWVAAAGFGGLFSLPIINGCSQAIWQTQTPPDLQGRVFSVRMVIAWSATPLAYLLAGPLADRVFEPLMTVQGPLAAVVGPLIGVGPGRGIALLLMTVGFLVALAALGGYRSSRLLRIEDELSSDSKAAIGAHDERRAQFQDLKGSSGQLEFDALD